MSEVFTRRLREMSAPAKASLAKALATASNSALVRSAFELPPTERAAIGNALNVTFSADVHASFETAPDLVCGIDVTASGVKLGWSIADYLASLEKNVGELLKEQNDVKLKVAAKPPEPKTEAKAPVMPETKREEPRHDDHHAS